MNYIQWFETKPFSIKEKMAMKNFNCLSSELCIKEIRFLYNKYNHTEVLIDSTLRIIKTNSRLIIIYYIIIVVFNIACTIMTHWYVYFSILTICSTYVLVRSLQKLKKKKDENKNRLLSLYDN